MEISRGVDREIVKGLSEFCQSEELQDFTVTVGKTIFRCHKVILAACSGFFRGLFRSGMKETTLNHVTLEDISSEAFQWILEAAYTGHGILTSDNVIHIWQTANQLQVTFIVNQCEMFVQNSLSLENILQYSYYGRLLSSKIVTENVWHFALKKCDSFFKTICFLKQPFEEVLSLIKSQDLATCCEDEVLKAVLKWVEYTPNKEIQSDASCLQGAKDYIHAIGSEIKRNKNEIMFTNIEDISNINSTTMCPSSNAVDITNCISCNDSLLCKTVVPLDENVPTYETGICEGTPNRTDNREHHLFELVSNARTCLASDGCLEMLLSHSLISETKKVRDVINRAILYQLQIGKRNGQWSSMATHRNNSEYENVAITFNTNSKLMAYSFSSNNWNECKSPPLFENLTIIEMVIVHKSLYCLCVSYDDDLGDECPLLVYRLMDSHKYKWSEHDASLILLNTTFSVVAVNDYIFIAQMNKFWKMNPSLSILVSLCDLPENEPICHLTNYDQKIFAFYSVSAEVDVGETGVLSFDLFNNTWTRLKNLEGPADGMTSFKDDDSIYLLQSNGNMWKIVQSQSGEEKFEFIVKMWRCHWSLLGAVIFLDELYLYGVKSETITNDPLRLDSLAGFFKKITYLQSLRTCNIKSRFLPFTVHKKFIEKK